jgi:peptidoglycan/xylan/chitin deacetylase (PgdA/CDA1 family)
VSAAVSIVVAGGTSAEVGRFAQALQRHTMPPSEIEVLVGPPGAAPAQGWNEAVRRAGAPVLILTRPDFVPSPDFPRSLLAIVRRSPDVIAIGRVAREPGGSTLTRYAAEQWENDQFAHFPTARVPLLAAAGAPLAIGRDRFLGMAGFAPGLDWGEEVDLVLRLSEAGAQLERTEETIGVRPAFHTERELLAQAESDGRGSARLYRHRAATLPHLELGSYSAAGRNAVRLRNGLLAAGVPPRLLASLPVPLPSAARGRWARFVVGYAFWRGVWRELTDRDTRVRLQHPPVILMYHAVGGPDERAGRYIVPEPRFAAQLRWLRRSGYHAVRLDEILEHRRRFQLSPARAVAITFDDGYEDNHRLAFPRLREAGMPATFFLVSAALGHANDWDREGELAGRPMLKPHEARDMEAAGMELGGHTRHHPPLSEIDPGRLDGEIGGGRDDLREALGGPVSSFAYPYGKTSPAALHAVERAGFLGAVCSRSGFNDPVVPAYALRRIEIRGTDSLADFAGAVRRGHRRRKAP